MEPPVTQRPIRDPGAPGRAGARVLRPLTSAGMGDFCFLHAADLHIDSQLRGLSRYDGAPAESLRNASRVAFEELVRVAVEREVRFVLLAGDLFDGDWSDYGTGLWFLSALRPLLDAGIGVYLIRGNHDADSKVEKRLTWPKGVREFRSASPQTIRIDELGVALHGQSYPEVHVETDLARDYPEPVDGLINIGLLHTGLEGGHDHGHYAPCTVRQLVEKGYDYWALGHVHKAEVLHEDPWVVFPGNLQGRHARETGPKGAVLVRVEDGRVAGVEDLVLDAARWERLTVDLAGAEGWDDLGSCVRAALEPVVAAAGERLLAARVQLAGETTLDRLLRVDPARARAEVLAAAQAADGEVWIEKVITATQPLRESDAEDGDGGLGQLLRSVESSTLEDEEAAAIAADLQALQDRLPAGVEVRPAELSTVQGALEGAQRLLSSLLRAGDASEEVEA